MVMVDKFVGLTDGISKTELTITSNNIFTENGSLTECGIIEHIAQSAAARVGYICRSEDKPIAIGYIGAISNFECFRQPVISEILATQIEVVQEVFNITLICANCFVGEEKVACCQMKIFLDV